MPYIKKIDREKFEESLHDIAINIKSKGEFNYCIYKLMKLFIYYNKENYDNYATCMSSVVGALLEFNRREISEYEDRKIEENGDVDIFNGYFYYEYQMNPIGDTLIKDRILARGREEALKLLREKGINPISCWKELNG